MLHLNVGVNEVVYDVEKQTGRGRGERVVGSIDFFDEEMFVYEILISLLSSWRWCEM